MKSSGTQRTKLLIGAALAVLTIAVYWQVLRNGFIALDDYDYITHNPHIKNGITLTGIRWALTAFYSSNWHPLTWVSHMLDMELYGLVPWGHHLTNLLLHLGCTLLLFHFLHRATGALWRSALVAALFAVHPLHVESVAWAAERKDVLCTFFLLISLCFYGSYALRRSRSHYLSSVAAAALALMAKPMAVSLPILLVLLDYWPLRRFTGPMTEQRSDPHCPPLPLRMLLLEKVPFALLSAASCWLTYAAQSAGHSVAGTLLPFLSRVENAALAYARYLIKMFYPVRLAVIYPLHLPVPAFPSAVAALALLVATAAVVWQRRRLPYLLTGWFWYLISLVPVIGIVQVGVQSMADRYTYIPLMGIFILLVWGAADAARRFRVPAAFSSVCAGGILLLLSFRSVDQVSLWRNDVTLFSHALAVTEKNYFAAKLLGDAYQSHYDHPEAIRWYLTALSFQPAEALVTWLDTNLAYSLAAEGDTKGAITAYNAAIAHDPANAQALSQLGQLLEKSGKAGEAAGYYGRVLSLEPDDADIHYRLGRILEQEGDRGRALGHFLTAVRLQPNFAEAHNSAGVIYALQGDCMTAITHFTEALRVRPGYLDAERNLDECREILRRQR